MKTLTMTEKFSIRHEETVPMTMTKDNKRGGLGTSKGRQPRATLFAAAAEARKAPLLVLLLVALQVGISHGKLTFEIYFIIL